MIRFITFLAALTAMVNISVAQPLQSELLSGAEKMVFQTTFSQQFEQAADFRINGLAFSIGFTIRQNKPSTKLSSKHPLPVRCPNTLAQAPTSSTAVWPACNRAYC